MFVYVKTGKSVGTFRQSGLVPKCLSFKLPFVLSCLALFCLTLSVQVKGYVSRWCSQVSVFEVVVAVLRFVEGLSGSDTDCVVNGGWT